MNQRMSTIELTLCIERLRDLPDANKNEAGHRCPHCAAPYLVSFGRRSKKWLAWHSLNPHCAQNGRTVTSNAATQEQAVEMCRIAANDGAVRQSPAPETP